MPCDHSHRWFEQLDSGSVMNTRSNFQWLEPFCKNSRPFFAGLLQVIVVSRHATNDRCIHLIPRSVKRRITRWPLMGQHWLITACQQGHVKLPMASSMIKRNCLIPWSMLEDTEQFLTVTIIWVLEEGQMISVSCRWNTIFNGRWINRIQVEQTQRFWFHPKSEYRHQRVEVTWSVQMAISGSYGLN